MKSTITVLVTITSLTFNGTLGSDTRWNQSPNAHDAYYDDLPPIPSESFSFPPAIHDFPDFDQQAAAPYNEYYESIQEHLHQEQFGGNQHQNQQGFDLGNLEQLSVSLGQPENRHSQQAAAVGGYQGGDVEPAQSGYGGYASSSNNNQIYSPQHGQIPAVSPHYGAHSGGQQPPLHTGESSPTGHEIHQASDSYYESGSASGYGEVMNTAYDIVDLEELPAASEVTNSIEYYIPDYDSSDCLLNIKQLPFNHGLIIDPQTISLLYPTYESYIHVKNGNQIIVACITGKKPFFTRKADGMSENFKTAVCRESRLEHFFKRQEYELDQFECRAMPLPTWNLVEYKAPFCNGFYTHFQFGFKISEDHFHVLYDVCALRYQTSFVKKQFTRSIGAHQEYNFPDVYFHDYACSNTFSQFFERLYESGEPRKHLIEQLGSEDAYNKLVQNTFEVNGESRTVEYSLTRGQLLEKEDFVFIYEQLAVLNYLNVEPMWSNVNDNNWKEAKKQIRKFATTRATPFDVYSGTFGQMAITEQRSYIKMYLGSNDNVRFKVPNFFYMIVHDAHIEAALVIVFHNSPTKKNKFCDDIQRDIGWIKLTSYDHHLGTAYVCDYRSFLKKITDKKTDIKSIPLLAVTDRLVQ